MKHAVGFDGCLAAPEATWKRSIANFLGQTEETVTDTLLSDKIVMDWEGYTCPHCGKEYR